MCPPPHLCGVVVRYWAEQTVCVVVNWEWGTCGVQMKVQGSPAVVWSSNSMSDVACSRNIRGGGVSMTPNDEQFVHRTCAEVGWVELLSLEHRGAICCHFLQGEQDTGAGMARAWRGLKAFFGLGWRGRGAGMSCFPRGVEFPVGADFGSIFCMYWQNGFGPPLVVVFFCWGRVTLPLWRPGVG
eukprot:gene8000-biopygen4601